MPGQETNPTVEAKGLVLMGAIATLLLIVVVIWLMYPDDE